MSKFQKYTIFAGLILALGLTYVGYSAIHKDKNNQKVGGFTLNRCSGGLTATSTLVTTAAGDHYYIKDTNAFNLGKTDETLTGTSTLECSIGNADLVDMNIFFVGSSTAAYPTWDYEFSFDGQNWFTPTVKTVQADNNLLYGTSTYSFQPGLDGAGDGNGTTSINVQITPLAAQFVRVHIGATGSTGIATGTAYVEIIKRNQN